MGKKGRRRNGGGGDGGLALDDDDGASLASASSLFSGGTQQQQQHDSLDALDAFAQALDDTYEARATTRERAFEALAAMLRNSVRLDDALNNASTLTARCVAGLRKGGPAEAAAAATALGLLLVTLGEPNEALYQEVRLELARQARQGKGAAARVAAAEALSIACFVAAEDELSTRAAMAALQGLWRADAPRLRAAALRGWALLHTSLAAPLATAELDAALAALAGLLHDADVDVRAAAGEGLGLLYRSSGLADWEEGGGNNDEDDDEEGAGAENDAWLELAVRGTQQQQQQQQQLDPQQQLDAQQQQQQQLEPQPSMPLPPAPEQQPLPPLGGRRRGAAAAAAAAAGRGAAGDNGGAADDAMSLASSSGGASGLERVVDRVRDLAANRGDEGKPRRSRRERAALRGAFRGLQNTLEGGPVAAQRIKLRHGDVLSIETPDGVVAVNAFRRFLAGGFGVHLQENPLLHSVFGFTPLQGRGERLTQQEKRHLRSDKAGSVARKGARAFKGAGAAAACGGGGDEW